MSSTENDKEHFLKNKALNLEPSHSFFAELFNTKRILQHAKCQTKFTFKNTNKRQFSISKKCHNAQNTKENMLVNECHAKDEINI